MAKDGAREPRCPGTGLTVPECSCHSCLERMLRELHPEVLGSEIRISREVSGGVAREDDPGTAEHSAA